MVLPAHYASVLAVSGSDLTGRTKQAFECQL